MRTIALLLAIAGFTFAEAPDAAKSTVALESLKAELAANPPLADVATKAFASTPLSKADAAAAREMLWKAHVASIKKDRAGEVRSAAAVALGFPGEDILPIAGIHLRP